MDLAFATFCFDFLSPFTLAWALDFDRPVELSDEVHAVGIMMFAARCGITGLELAMWSIEQCLSADGTEALLDKLGW